MPLFSITQVETDVTVALWHITESLEEFQALFPQFPSADQDNDGQPPCCGTRRLERYAAHALLNAVTGKETFISHLPSGKPVIPQGYISVSHTRGYAAIIYSPTREVAIDIEYPSERVDRVAHKFLRDDEPLLDTQSRLVAWCAKEAAFKYYSSDNLLFADMKITPFSLQEGTCQVENLKRRRLLSLHFKLTADFVLVYGY